MLFELFITLSSWALTFPWVTFQLFRAAWYRPFGGAGSALSGALHPPRHQQRLRSPELEVHARNTTGGQVSAARLLYVNC